MTIITNASLITWGSPNRILTHHALRYADGIITHIAPQAELIALFDGEEQIDAGGQYVMPGNICAHTHFYGAFSRGMNIPGAAPRDFPEILARLWWPLDQALTEEDVYYSALVCLVDAVRHGTTTLIDHHASPNAIAGSLDVIAQAVNEAGVRAALCYEVTDRGGMARARAGIDENARFLRRVQSTPVPNAGAMLGASFGLHASLTLSEETLSECAAAASDFHSGVHIHVAEAADDEYDSLAKSGERVVDRLERHGLLGPRSIAVHCVHVDAREINLLAQSGTWVTHQPRSNMNNAVGLPPVESMLRAGVKVCLGNDGFSNAMWEDWKAAYLGHKLFHRDPRRMSAAVIAQMATENNAALAQTLLPGPAMGVLEEGARADLILVDYQPITPVTEGNLPWHMIFGFHESMITTTIAAGKVLMRDRVLTTLNPQKIAAEARIHASRVWERYEAILQEEQ